ncbi:MAG: ketosteroid isomerase family protein [Cyanobacteria bacterium J06597_1]
MTHAQSANLPALESLDSESMETFVRQYFERFNQGEFQEVANLFSTNGTLYPPFESPVVGQEAISTYLHKEADGMKAEPASIEACPLEDGTWQVDAIGKVTALVFQVNVAWSFIVTAQCELASVKVDLKASLQELLKIRPTGAELMP